MAGTRRAPRRREAIASPLRIERDRGGLDLKYASAEGGEVEDDAVFLEPEEYVLSVRCSGARRRRKDGGAVAADHFHARVVGQPAGQGGGFAVGENVDGPVDVDVDQDRAVGVTLAEGTPPTTFRAT
jgi:hypothetical protein